MSMYILRSTQTNKTLLTSYNPKEILIYLKEEDLSKFTVEIISDSGSIIQSASKFIESY